MIFLSTPKAYSSYNEPLIYVFDTESTAPRNVELKIKNKETGQTIGRKRLYGVTYGEVDIAPYLRSAAQPTLPDFVAENSVVETSAQIKVVVEAEGVSSPSRTFIAAKVDLTEPYTPLMTQHLKRTIDRDEFDIVSFFSLPDIVVRVVVEYLGSDSRQIAITPPSGGQRAVAVSARGMGNVDAMRVTIYVDGEAATTIDYQLRENLAGARRLAWLNRHHAPELYTFPLRKSVLVESTRKYMESQWGREAAALEKHGELKLLSAYEPRAQIEAISEILHSTRVWLVKGNNMQHLSLHTDRVLTAPCGEMGIVEVDVRAAREGEEL